MKWKRKQFLSISIPRERKNTCTFRELFSTTLPFFTSKRRMHCQRDVTIWCMRLHEPWRRLGRIPRGRCRRASRVPRGSIAAPGPWLTDTARWCPPEKRGDSSIRFERRRRKAWPGKSRAGGAGGAGRGTEREWKRWGVNENAIQPRREKTESGSWRSARLLLFLLFNLTSSELQASSYRRRTMVSQSDALVRFSINIQTAHIVGYV